MRGYIDSTNSYVGSYFKLAPGVIPPATWTTGGTMPLGKSYTPIFPASIKANALIPGLVTFDVPELPAIWGY